MTHTPATDRPVPAAALRRQAVRRLAETGDEDRFAAMVARIAALTGEDAAELTATLLYPELVGVSASARTRPAGALSLMIDVLRHHAAEFLAEHGTDPAADPDGYVASMAEAIAKANGEDAPWVMLGLLDDADRADLALERRTAERDARHESYLDSLVGGTY